MSDRTHFVYRAFDREGELLYIGCTSNLDQRRAAHRSTSDWYPYAASFRIAGPFDRETALRIEKQAIETEGSWFNGTSEDRRHWLRWNRAHTRAWNELVDQHPHMLPNGHVDSPRFQALCDAVDAHTDVPRPQGKEGRLARYLDSRRAA